MAISGSLRDVSVADVMQFVYIGRRTGALQLSRGGETAILVFEDGRLVRARSPHGQNVGDLLIQRGYLRLDELRAVLAERPAGDTLALGQLLVGHGLITAAQLGEALDVQIQQAINGVLNWEDGAFEFHAGEVETPDDFSSFNDVLVPRDGFNPQLLLLEAAHIFDQRGDAPADPRPVTAETRTVRQSVTAAAAMGDALRTTEGWRRSLDLFFADAGSARSLTELWWVSHDAAFFRGLSEALAAQPVQTRRVTSASARRLDSAGPEPLILVDLRGGEAQYRELALLRQTQREATFVAIADVDADAARIFAAGAQALLPAHAAAIVAFVEHLLAEPRSPRDGPAISPTGMQRLRRVYEELRAGLTSATVALTLMRLISESFDRAVLLLPKRDTFSVLGAFGLAAGGRALAVAMRGLVLRNDGDDAFGRTLRSTNFRRHEPGPEGLPEPFRRVLGEPLAQQSVFPVGGAEQVIALVYADNREQLPDEEVQILELAAAQVGIALENELLRRRAPPPTAGGWRPAAPAR
jgi:GAF domain-containing protein